jgi:hypothetical protein
MIQTLFTFFPARLDTLALVLAMVGAAFGAVLWLCGSIYNRTLVTLMTVCLGMLVGLQLPAWFGWKVDGWATGLLTTLVFGVSGYAWSRAWVGLGLGLVLACWAAVGTFAYYGFGTGPGGLPWVMPISKPGMTLGAWSIDFWNSLSTQTRQVLPFACAAGMLSGIGAVIAWPRFGTVLHYSTLGLSLLIGLGTAAVMSTRPSWLGVVPNQMSSQVVVLVSLIAFGAIFQWRANPATAGGNHAQHGYMKDGHPKGRDGKGKDGGH